MPLGWLCVHLQTSRLKKCRAIWPTRLRSCWVPAIRISGKRCAVLCSSRYQHVITVIQAALCALRVVKKVPDIADHFIGKAKNLLTDRNHGVLLAAITLVIEMVQIDESILNEFRSVRPLPCSNTSLAEISAGRPSPCPQPQISCNNRLQSRTRCVRHYRPLPTSQDTPPNEAAWKGR